MEDDVDAEGSIYAAHLLFWAAFGITRAFVWARRRPQTEPAQPITATATAPHSRALLLVHTLAFGVMYFGLGDAVLGGRGPGATAVQRAAGALVITAGGALVCWALAHFESWRIRAQLDAGHRLATAGPFRYLRHPIYMGLNLLAIGSAISVPTLTVWASVALMFVGGDVRARAEEKLLLRVFGADYRDYCARRRRFIPRVY